MHARDIAIADIASVIAYRGRKGRLLNMDDSEAIWAMRYGIGISHRRRGRGLEPSPSCDVISDKTIQAMSFAINGEMGKFVVKPCFAIKQ